MKKRRDPLLAKTLEELEGAVVREPKDSDTHLVQTCLRLMRVPVNRLTTEDLRMLIGQAISLEVLVPLALDTLEQDPLAAGNLYFGDLLHAVVRVPIPFWTMKPELRARLDSIIGDLKDRIRFVEREVLPHYDRIYGG